MATIKRYNEFQDFLKLHFSGKVQKISVNAGFTCPNRDGSKAQGGCTYCNNHSFSPEYTHKVKTVTQQLSEGVQFFSGKYPQMNFLAYFQSYTNTYDDVNKLRELYEEALQVDKVVGLVISTRPDCLGDDVLDLLEEISKKSFLLLEFGIESTIDSTLEYINRAHTFAESADAIRRSAARGINVGGHLILGLPGESHEQILSHADELSKLPLTTVKMHQLQLHKHTKMLQQYDEQPELFHFFEIDEYIDLAIDFVERLNPNFFIERFVSQAPKNLLIMPKWGTKNADFIHQLDRRMEERDARQGARYQNI
ncbi:MAG: TIGR01212 family radical SAM protein [Bacteroidales bacterium]|nr:TIGR01212 family radical SAM protein [Bacteroidales bacterium]